MKPQRPHLLFSLPPEIRLEIYLWATPPRVVHVKETVDEDGDDFMEEIRTLPNRLQIDPSLAHFAFNWSPHVSGMRWRQRKLESFGFTNSRPQHQPWSPSTSTPEMRVDWLDENPEIAWEFARKSHLYSKAPIPTLLHVCRDSQAMLMGHGYQLAFRTRSSQPRTWFHFGRDVLFLQKEKCCGYKNTYQILSASSWAVGQFYPEDMCKVRNLALDESSDIFSAAPQLQDLFQIQSIIQLFPQLDELRLVEWSNKGMQRWPPGLPVMPPIPNRNAQKHMTRELWTCVLIEETDFLCTFLPTDVPWYNSFSAGGFRGHSLLKYKKEHGPMAPFFKDTGLELENAVAKHMESAVNSKEIPPMALWKVPRITVSHILSQSMYEILCRSRRALRRQLRDLREQWTLAKRASDATVCQPSVVTNPEQELAQIHWPEPPDHNCEICDGWCEERRMGNAFTKWWIQEALDV